MLMPMARISRPPTAVELGEPVRGEIGLAAGGAEGEQALVEHHRHEGQDHAGPVGAGQDQAHRPVEHGLGEKQGAIAAQGLVKGAENGHGAGAEHHRSRDQAVGEQDALRMEQGLQPVAGQGHAAFEIAGLAAHGAGQHADHDQDGRGHGQGHLEADEHDGQAQGLEHGDAHPVGKPAVQRQANQGADDDGRAIDQGTQGKHAQGSFATKKGGRRGNVSPGASGPRDRCAVCAGNPPGPDRIRPGHRRSLPRLSRMSVSSGASWAAWV